MNKSQTTREQAIDMGLLYREAEWRPDAELFLDEYPRRDIGAPHQSVILHEMFLHTTEWGQKEEERFICGGHQGSLPRPDSEVDQSTIKLVGYWTSHKEIRDLYHSVYLLSRLPGPLPCGPQQRREAIQDILSSLRNCLHWQVYPITTKEDTQGSINKSWSRPRGRGDPHEEALWEARAACQRVLEAVQVLERDIERLSQGLRDVQWAHPHSHSNSCQQSQSLDREPKSLSGPQQGRRVTFWEPEIKPDPEERPCGRPSSGIFPESGDGVLPAPQGKEVHIPQGGPWPIRTPKVGKVTLQNPPSGRLKPGWIGRPTSWICLVGGWNLLPFQGWKTHRNLLRRSGPPFQFQQSEAGSSQAKGIPHPLPLSASPRMCSSQINCPIKTCDSSLFF